MLIEPTLIGRYNLGDLVKFSCTLYCLHEYVADVTAVRLASTPHNADRSIDH